MKLRTSSTLALATLAASSVMAAPLPPEAGGGSAAGQLIVWPARPAQGQTLFFRVPLDGPAREARASFGPRAIPVAQSGGALVGVIGLRIAEPVGGRTLRVSYRDARGEPREVSRLLQIARTDFPVRRLTMAPSTARLYAFPGAKEEDAAVSRAVRTYSATWLWSAPFLMPAQGRPSTPFGVERIRNNRTRYHHRGADIAAPTGTPIISPATGRVVLSRDFRKYGGTVVLDHGGGVTTLYLHMSARAVKEGETVRAGEPLGKIGATGVATGPHLHWSLYVHGTAVNPIPWTRLPDTFYARR